MYFNIITLLAIAGTAAAHMHLDYPPTLKGDNNPFTSGDADPLLNYPYGCCGKEAPGPCKGHLDLLDTDEGRPVVTWAPGQKVNFTLSGNKIKNTIDNVQGGTHYGGSCEIGFSVDKGKTFKVASTWQGNCPLRDGGEDPSGQVFDFTVPADIPAGERVLFAWTWVNREKEFNMNCASINIKGDSQEPVDPPSSSTNPGTSSAMPTNAPKTSSAAPKRPSATSPAPEQPSAPVAPPSSSQGANPQPTGGAQYTLDGCSCSCPYQTWTPACTCYSCKSPTTKRHIVERKALELHKRHMQNAERLNAPVRRAETVAFQERPDMLIDIDYAGAKCHSKGGNAELKFPDPGPDVVEGDGEYPLEEPDC